MNDGGAFERIDHAVDAAFEPLRGRPPVDRAATAFSNLSDYGLIWVLLALLKMRSKGPRRRRAIVGLGAAGFSSLLLSRAVKQSVERERPDEHLTANVRTPTSSSFPSGHTLAAFCTAIVLPESEVGTTAAVSFAAAVAASRVHLRAHHPTDVIGGAVIGSALGLLVRGVLNTAMPSPRKRRSRSARRSGRGMEGPDYLLTQIMKSFAVTWDYRCPFARNAHEHLVAGLADGADWDVTFLPYSLSQVHVPEGGTPVWDDPTKEADLMALAAGVVVRDRYPEQFGAAHLALFTARHDEGLDLRVPDVVADVLDRAGVPGADVLAEVKSGDPIDEIRRAHTEAVSKWEVFGVPTFIVDDRAVFVRLMSRNRGDGALGRRTVDGVLDLFDAQPDLNEFKYTTLSR